MTDNQPQSESTSEPRTSGISGGRVVTWVLIAALAAVTGVEALARTSYNGTLQALEELNIDSSDNGIELSEIDRHVSGWTNRETSKDGQVVIRWVSLLKDYTVTLHPESNQVGRISGFETSEAGDYEIEAPSLPEGIPAGLPPDPSGMGTSSGGGSAGGLAPPPPPAGK
ncbi:MAG TPA: hypothetical protein DCE47_10345 [Planctomycetaceae bacterium]|nr:hypothetical protein [Planctomycetaceae bacterium]HCD01491.1 hypothetical protein [Planctomycetaceae bacterium]|tara:strand:+ start:1996 stop:2502 length:507 start_codon:yes stop_codon:yes gene_type:complete